ncbi:hypothetical protein BDA96_06G172700 [Sorghum bicolor]|uniref:DUF223 domain-containing protein n=1 Tax=Sorghum bicolor TaxID=4558 RepID=A0A921QUC6_SORBI|nr:hypothetical protein BDA96_06G172700 [Sorghum bicolor]
MPTSLSLKRVCAEFVESSEMTRFKRFQDIQLVDIGYSWSITVRIEAKFPFYRDSQRFILMDTMGCKLVGIMSGPETERFNRLLQQGRDYTIHDVRFQIKPHSEFRNIQSNYECRFDHLTTVEPWKMPIQFPVCSNHLTSVLDVMHCPSKTYIDFVGILVHWGEIERPHSGLCREVVFMDKRCDLVVVIMSCKVLAAHKIKLQNAALDNTVVFASMLRVNHIHRCLETSDYTTLAFNPPHRAANELQGIRQAFVTKADTTFINRFVARRWSYLATVV